MANIAKVRFSLVETSIGNAEVWSDDREAVEVATLSGEKIRSIDYIYFPSIKIPAKGKTPASFLTVTASEFKKMAECVANPAMPASVYLSMTNPLLNSACLSDDDTIRETFSMVTKMVEEYEATKPAGSSPVRKVEDYMVSTLANAFLIAAGITGEVPESLNFNAYIAKARAEAMNKAKLLGRDANGQFRLKKAKEAKDASSEEAGE